MPTTVRPIAFISHAGEDRSRFVEQFATRLIENGVDAWASFWDVLPGDDLIRSIFDNGIGTARIFIIVLSANSVCKPWIREELSAGMVRKIAGTMRVIPVRLDQCQIPESLKHMAWQEISDIDNYELEFRRIVDGILGVVKKPAAGERPAYAKSAVLKIGDLTQRDSAVLEAGCRIAIEIDGPLVNTEPLLSRLTVLELSESQVIESLTILDELGYVDILNTMGPPAVRPFTVTTFGFDKFVHAAIEDWNSLLAEVAAILVRESAGNHRSIANHLGRPTFLIEHAFRVLEINGKIKFAQSIGGGIHLDILSVSPGLKRSLEGLDRFGELKSRVNRTKLSTEHDQLNKMSWVSMHKHSIGQRQVGLRAGVQTSEFATLNLGNGAAAIVTPSSVESAGEGK